MRVWAALSILGFLIWGVQGDGHSKRSERHVLKSLQIDDEQLLQSLWLKYSQYLIKANARNLFGVIIANTGLLPGEHATLALYSRNSSLCILFLLHRTHGTVSFAFLLFYSYCIYQAF